MADRWRIARDVDRIVSLRLLEPSVGEPAARRRLKRLQRGLRLELGPGVPKSQAAAVLGVTVTALDKWVARGRLPVVRKPGSSRREIDTDALLDLAEEAARLKEAGHSRGVLAAAFRRLDESDRLGSPARPNQSARDLRGHYLRTTAVDRLRETAELSLVLTRLAAQGAQRR